MEENLDRKTEYLPNFPFQNHEEFLDALSIGLLDIRIAPQTLLGWAASGAESPKMLRFFTKIFCRSTEIISVCFAAFVGFQKDLLYLFLTPVIFLSPYVLTPSSAFIYPRLRPIIIFGLLLFTPLSIILKLPTCLTVWFICELLVWIMGRLVFSVPNKYLRRTGFKDKDLLALFWHSDALGLFIANGDHYYLKFKVIDGKIITHESSKNNLFNRG